MKQLVKSLCLTDSGAHCVLEDVSEIVPDGSVLDVIVLNVLSIVWKFLFLAVLILSWCPSVVFSKIVGEALSAFVLALFGTVTLLVVVPSQVLELVTVTEISFDSLVVGGPLQAVNLVALIGCHPHHQIDDCPCPCLCSSL